MNRVTKTIYFDDLLISYSRGKDYEPLLNTTLNEKFGVLTDYNKSMVGNPTLQYFAIGNGSIPTLSTFDEANLHYGNHRIVDGALFNHIPFVMRPIDNDITTQEQAMYRMKVRKKYGDIEYFMYYLKVLPGSADRNQIILIDKESEDDNAKISLFYSNDISILNPTPKTMVEDISDISKQYIACSDQIPLLLTKEELIAIKENIVTMGGNVFNINEIAMVSGIDYLNLQDASTETVKAQVALFVEMDYSLELAINEDDTFYKEVELGGMAPYALR